MDECEGDYTDEMAGATFSRDDVAKARAEEMAWYDKFEVTNKTSCQEQDANPSHVDGKTSTRVTVKVWKHGIDRSRVRSNRKGSTGTSQKHGTRTLRDQHGCKEVKDREATTNEHSYTLTH